MIIQIKFHLSNADFVCKYIEENDESDNILHLIFLLEHRLPIHISSDEYNPKNILINPDYLIYIEFGQAPIKK